MSVPKHISIVLDGNRRWAASAGKPAWEGHLRALDTINDLVDWSSNAGVGYLTLYLFSTENWSRTEEELANLFGRVAKVAVESKFPKLLAAGARVQVWGDLARFPAFLRQGLEKLVEDSRDNNKIVVNFCLGYGGRGELVDAFGRMLADGVTAQDLDEERLSKYLFSVGIPDPDMMIRTGGERRLSNFLLWQHAYSELYFVDKFLPDFTEEDFAAALGWYAERERRYGR